MGQHPPSAPWVVAALTLPLLSGCIATPDAEPVRSADEVPSPITFGTSVIAWDSHPKEPGLFVAPNGDIYVCWPRGLGFGSELYRSLDGGASFQSTGSDLPLPEVRVGPLWVPYGPKLRSGGGDLGGGDCAVGADEADTVYLANLWLGGVSISSSSDRGATWRGVPVTLPHATLDRPWVLGGRPGEVFVTAAQLQSSGWEGLGLSPPPVGGIWVARSTDGGLTFPQQVLAVPNENRIGLNSNLAIGANNLYLAYTQKVGEGRMAVMIAVSHDRGATWSHWEVAVQSFYPGQCLSPLFVFPVVAADDAGGVYAAWVLINPETARHDLFIASSSDGGETWNTPVSVADRAGTRAYPWIAAGGSGRVGIVWYETNAATMFGFNDETPARCVWAVPDDAEWSLHYAFSDHASQPAPVFREVLVQAEPVDRGELTNRAAEYPMVAFDPAGRAAITYVSTSLDTRTDVPGGNGLPMFALQESGPWAR